MGIGETLRLPLINLLWGQQGTRKRQRVGTFSYVQALRLALREPHTLWDSGDWRGSNGDNGKRRRRKDLRKKKKRGEESW